MAQTQEELQEKLKQLSPQQIQELIKKQCVFCKIAAGEMPAKKIYEDNNFMAFLSIQPANPGHTIVIPKEHFSVLPQLPDELNADCLALIKKLAAVIFETVNATGINVLQNNGAAAGQKIPHVHFEIIPRFEKDNVGLEWSTMKLKEEQFVQVQKRLVETLAGFKLSKKPVVYDMSGVPIEEAKKKARSRPKKLPKIEPRLP